MDGLDRFRTAQNIPGGGFEMALAELRQGAKRSHWIWFIFPQLAGLGRSAMARHYGLRDVDEATAYLEDSELGARLVDATRMVVEQQRRGVSLRTLMGSEIDAVKLVSSMTLFAAVARRLAGVNQRAGELAPLADEVLAAAQHQGFPRCEYTAAAIFRNFQASPQDS